MKVPPIDPIYRTQKDYPRPIPYGHSPKGKKKTNQDEESRLSSRDGLGELIDITV
jgi:hypothetical protein